jgi:hypothetical protein
MRLEASDLDALQPLIDAAVRSTLSQIQAADAKLGARLAFTEPEAAAAMGIARHVLRDARLRGELKAKRVGKRLLYSRAELSRYLESGD